MKTDIVVTSSAEHLAKILSKNSAFSIHYLGKNKDDKKYFPDGEVYVNLEDFSGERVVVLHSGAPSVNDGLVELEFLLGLLKERKTKSVELFLTYFPYGKQDMAFKAGEINAAETLISKWIEFYNVKKIYIIDAHFAGRDWVNKYPIENISGVEILQKIVLTKYPDVIFIAPDAGSVRRNSLSGFAKKRKNSHEVETSCDDDFKRKVEGKKIGIVDDMIETGGTMVSVCKKCKELGATKIIAVVTHGVLQSGVDRIKNSYDELYLTNSIENDASNVDVSGLIADSLAGK